MIMVWMNVKDSMPKPYEVFWIYWRDREVLLGCITDAWDDSHPEWGWYSFEDEKCKWAFHWQRVDRINFDNPKPPTMSEIRGFNG